MTQFKITTRSFLENDKHVDQTHTIEAPRLLHALMLAEVHAQDECENVHNETSEFITVTHIDNTYYPNELPISQTHIIDATQLTLLLYTASEYAYDYDQLTELLAESEDETFDLFVRLAFQLTQIRLTPSLAIVASRKIVSLASNVLLFNAAQDNEWTVDAYDALDKHMHAPIAA